MSRAVILVALGALLGHALDVHRLTAWIQSGADMMPLTALNFVVAGVVVELLPDRGRLLRDAAIMGLGSFVTVTMLIVAVAFGLVTVPWSEPRLHLAVGSGVPSLGTAIGFLLFAGAVWSVLRGRSPRPFAGVIAGIGACALLGYALGIPALFFHSPEFSTAMAIHTAGCFIALAVELERRFHE